MKKRFTGKHTLLLLAILLSAPTPALPQKKDRRNYPTAIIRKAEWVVNDPYRLVVTVNPGPLKRRQTPVAVDVNFSDILKTAGINGRLNKNSLRIVRFDPQTGQALPLPRRALFRVGRCSSADMPDRLKPSTGMVMGWLTSSLVVSPAGHISSSALLLKVIYPGQKLIRLN